MLHSVVGKGGRFAGSDICLATIVFPGWRQLEVPVDGGRGLSVGVVFSGSATIAVHGIWANWGSL